MIYHFMVILAAVSLLSGFSTAGDVRADATSTYQFEEEVSTDSVLYVRGIISKVAPEEGVVYVRPAKGERIGIEITLETIHEGFDSIEELQKKQQLKVWYRVDGERNEALKIKLLMDLGC